MDDVKETPTKEWEKRIQTILLSVITAAVLGLFNFQWTMNRDFGVMQERDRVRSENEIQWKNDLKEMKVDVTELKGKNIQLEGKVDEIQDKLTNK